MDSDGLGPMLEWLAKTATQDPSSKVRSSAKAAHQALWKLAQALGR